MVIHSGMIHSSYDYLPTWSKQVMITNNAFHYRLKILQWIIFLAIHSCVFEWQLLENAKCKTYRLILRNTLRKILKLILIWLKFKVVDVFLISRNTKYFVRLQVELSEVYTVFKEEIARSYMQQNMSIVRVPIWTER